MNELRVGGQCPYTSGKPEGCYLIADASGLTLIHNYFRPEQNEIDEMSSGKPIEFRFVVVGGLLWFLSKPGSLNWTEAPYHPSLSPESAGLHRPVSASEGIALTHILVRADDNTILSLRMIGLGNRFSRELCDALDSLRRSPMDLAAYYSSVYLVQQTKQTTDLVKMAIDRCKIG